MAFDGEDKGYKALDDRLIDGPLIALRMQAAGSGHKIAGNGVIKGLVDAMRLFVSEEPAEMDMSMRRERCWLFISHGGVARGDRECTRPP